MKVEQPKVFLCDVCKCNKTGVKKLRTYNGTFVNSCPSCREEMALTLQTMKISADWYLKHRNKEGKLTKSSKLGVLTPIDATS